MPTGTYPCAQADPSFYTMQYLEIFTHEDILEAIKSTNFDKGLGPDGFDGHVLI